MSMKHLIFQNWAQFLRTDAHWIDKIKWFPLSMLILGQKPCFLEPTIFEIPQSKPNFSLCLAMAMNSGLLCPRWLYLHSQCAASRREPRAAANVVAAAVHASSRWAYSGGGSYGTSAARRLARMARRAACTALSSLCWKQQSAKFNIQTSRSLQPFCLLESFPFYSFFFIWVSGKGLHYVNFIGFLKARDLDLNQP